MAQMKLEFVKEKDIPYKVIVKLEEETGADNNKYVWQDDDDYYYGQHWKLKEH